MASCYGLRLFAAAPGKQSQFESVVSTLRRDPDSRRAIFTILGGEDINVSDSLGLPCTVSLQVLVRDGKLSMHAMMRSCDAYRGLPYDLFFFTLLQELIAATLGLELGSYTHSAASAHIYESDVSKAERCLQSKFTGKPIEMRPVSSGIVPNDIASVDSGAPQCNTFLADLASVLKIGQASDRADSVKSFTFYDAAIEASVNQFLQSENRSLEPCSIAN